MGLRIVCLLHRIAFIASRGSRRLCLYSFPSPLSPPPLSLLPNDSGLSFREFDHLQVLCSPTASGVSGSRQAHIGQ